MSSIGRTVEDRGRPEGGRGERETGAHAVRVRPRCTFELRLVNPGRPGRGSLIGRACASSRGSRASTGGIKAVRQPGAQARGAGRSPARPSRSTKCICPGSPSTSRTSCPKSLSTPEETGGVVHTSDVSTSLPMHYSDTRSLLTHQSDFLGPVVHLFHWEEVSQPKTHVRTTSPGTGPSTPELIWSSTSATRRVM